MLNIHLTRAGYHRIIRCGVPEGEFAFSLEKKRERIRSFDPARVKINSLSSIMLHSTEFWLVPNEERIVRKNKKLLFNDESIGVHYIDEDETNENFRPKGMDHSIGLNNSIIR